MNEHRSIGLPRLTRKHAADHTPMRRHTRVSRAGNNLFLAHAHCGSQFTQDREIDCNFRIKANKHYTDSDCSLEGKAYSSEQVRLGRWPEAYSQCGAAIGLIRMARPAGIYAASNATAIITRATPPKIQGSRAVTPNSNLSIPRAVL